MFWIHYFLMTNSFFVMIFDVEEVLWPLRLLDISSVDCRFFFLLWDWLHFFLSIDFLNWTVLPNVLPKMFAFWFSLLNVSYLDFTDIYFTLTDDYFIRLMAYWWFWQIVFCKSFYNYIIFLSLYLSYRWNDLFMWAIFSNFLCKSKILHYFYLSF